ncbi:MAG: 50S ribosomal protein L13 [Candidatus Omnitrophica bacterium]|nr:50S ribosomal protein L13 [Candidatus Omnitrophota bacterium]
MLTKEEAKHEWYQIDVENKVLGRAATKIANLLSGKYRSDYTPHTDGGAGVVVLNCDKVKVTGKKAEQKEYKSFSGYPSGQKIVLYKDMKIKKPEHMLRHAVKGMLPKNKLADVMIKRLKLYVSGEHKQEAQNPKIIEL